MHKNNIPDNARAVELKTLKIGDYYVLKSFPNSKPCHIDEITTDGKVWTHPLNCVGHLTPVFNWDDTLVYQMNPKEFEFIGTRKPIFTSKRIGDLDIYKRCDERLEINGHPLGLEEVVRLEAALQEYKKSL